MRTQRTQPVGVQTGSMDRNGRMELQAKRKSWRESWVPDAKPDNLSLTPNVHMVEEKNQLPEAVLRPPHVCPGIMSQIYTYIK